MLPDQLRLETGLTIRPPAADDDAAIGRLLSMMTPAEMTPEKVVERRERYAKRKRVELIATFEGEILGWAEYIEGRDKDGGVVRVIVEPEARRRGVGSVLYDLLDLYDLYKLHVEVKDDQPEALAFALERGFVVRRRLFETILELDRYDITPYLPLIEKVRGEFRIVTAADLGDTEEVRYKMWEIEHITDMDMPGQRECDLTSWDDARDIIYTASWYDPAGEFLALDGDRVVGISGVAEVAPGEFYNQHTATLREYRGRGLASALKALSVDFAKRKGGRLMRTNNHEGNDPMIAINRKMGYIDQPGWYELERKKER